MIRQCNACRSFFSRAWPKQRVLMTGVFMSIRAVMRQYKHWLRCQYFPEIHTAFIDRAFCCAQWRTSARADSSGLMKSASGMKTSHLQPIGISQRDCIPARVGPATAPA